jgi:putative addiction module component (TIGR02574 family)
MSSDAEQVLTAALDLPDDERMEIVEALILSFQPSGEPPFDETWREVIERRSSELETGSVAGIPWAEVKRRARDGIGG